VALGQDLRIYPKPGILQESSQVRDLREGEFWITLLACFSLFCGNEESMRLIQNYFPDQDRKLAYT